MKAHLPFLLLLLIGLLAHPAAAQCVTSLVTAASCTAPGGVSTFTDAGGANTNVVMVGGTRRYTGTAGISNMNMAGGTLYYASNGTLNGANISGGTIIFQGSGAASGITQSGGTLQVCGGASLSITGNLNGGSFVVASGGQLTFPNTFTLQNSAKLTNYGTVTFQNNLTIASGSTGVFVNAGTVNATNSVFLNGPGLVNLGTANFGTLTVNGSGRACLGNRSVLSVATYQTNDNANSITVSPTSSARACLRVSGYGNFNANLATDSPSGLVVCRAGTASSTEVNRYGTATVRQNCTSCAVALPVELTRFEATYALSAVQLSWATASEKNSAYFDVQRSADGRSFGTIGRVVAAGSSNTPLTYALRDPQPLPGTSYYRLHQVDFDGASAYSPVVVVTRKVSPLTASPNPAAGLVHLSGPLVAGTSARVQLLDPLGRCVRTASVPVGQSSLDLPLTGLPAGCYVLLWNGGTGPQRLRLAVE